MEKLNFKTQEEAINYYLQIFKMEELEELENYIVSKGWQKECRGLFYLEDLKYKNKNKAEFINKFKNNLTVMVWLYLEENDWFN